MPIPMLGETGPLSPQHSSRMTAGLPAAKPNAVDPSGPGASLPPSLISSLAPGPGDRGGLGFVTPFLQKDWEHCPFGRCPGPGPTAQMRPSSEKPAQLIEIATLIPGEPQRKQKAHGYLCFFWPGNSAPPPSPTQWKGYLFGIRGARNKAALSSHHPLGLKATTLPPSTPPRRSSPVLPYVGQRARTV